MGLQRQSLVLDKEKVERSQSIQCSRILRLFFSCILSTAVLATIGTDVASANLDDAYLRGIEYFKNADYDSAEKELKQSNLPDAKILIAIIIFNYTKSDKTRESYARQLIVEAAKQGNSQALFETALSAYEQKDFKRFERNISKVAVTHKIAAISYSLYLATVENPSRIGEAIYWAEKAISLGCERGAIAKAHHDAVYRGNYYFYREKIEKIISSGFSEAYLLKFLFEKKLNNKEDIMWLYLASDLEDNQSKNFNLQNYSFKQKTDAKQRALNWLVQKAQDKSSNLGQSAQWCLTVSSDLNNKCLTYAVTDDFGCRSIQIRDLDTTSENYRQSKSYQACRMFTLNNH